MDIDDVDVTIALCSSHLKIDSVVLFSWVVFRCPLFAYLRPVMPSVVWDLLLKSRIKRASRIISKSNLTG